MGIAGATVRAWYRISERVIAGDLIVADVRTRQLLELPPGEYGLSATFPTEDTRPISTTQAGRRVYRYRGHVYVDTTDVWEASMGKASDEVYDLLHGEDDEDDSDLVRRREAIGQFLQAFWQAFWPHGHNG